MILKLLKRLFTKPVVVTEPVAPSEQFIPTKTYDGQSRCVMCDKIENPYHAHLRHSLQYTLSNGKAMIRRVCYQCGYSWYEWPRSKS